MDMKLGDSAYNFAHAEELDFSTLAGIRSSVNVLHDRRSELYHL